MGRYFDSLKRLLTAVGRRIAEPKQRVSTPPAASRPPVPPGAGSSEGAVKGLEEQAPSPNVQGQVLVKQGGAGRLLQFPRANPGRPTDIVIGLDFGTSCSKVVMQSPYTLGGRAIAVPFGEMSHSSTPYLIPTQVFVDKSDSVRLIPTDGATAIRHLKVGILDRLIGGENGSADEFAKDLVACTIGYLALVLREARGWFLTSQSETYGNDHIGWSVNLGIPSAGYDDEEMRAEYETLARAAWLASLDDRPLRMDSIQDALQRARVDRDCVGIPIEVVPEVAAQVVGYAKSRLREEGLHVLVDLGASTLDICSFVLHRQGGDDVYSLLTATVRRLGLLELHRRRMAATRKTPPFDSTPDDIVAALPSWVSDQIPSPALRGQLEQCDARFRTECMRLLCGTILDLRQKRDPLSRRWRDGLPVFVCGGGALSGVFRDFLRQANDEATKVWNMKGLHHRPMPALGLLGADGKPLDPAIFNRVNVAYGLSFPAINIGTIEPPNDIEDIDPPRRRRRWEDGFVGKEQV